MVVTVTLSDFLKSGDLDELATIKQSLPPMSGEDSDQLQNTLLAWNDKQAVANLLMYPDLISERERIPSLLKALEALEIEYYPLAAIVGLHSISPHTFLEDQRAEIFETLLGYLDSESPVIRNRISITVGQYQEPHELDRMARWLNYPDDVIKHNILAALLAAAGVEQTHARLVDVLEGGRLSHANRPFLQDRCQQLQQCLAASDKAVVEQVLTSLMSPQMGYIPNLTEWRT